MKKQTLKHLAVSSALLGLMLTASVAGAQVRGIKMLPGKRVGASASQASARPSITPGSPTYAFTLLNYPGQLYTFANGINKGATTSKVWIVGSYGLTEDGFSVGGFLTRVSGTKTVTEAYQAVNYPHGTEQGALGINDLGQIVGSYTDSSGFSHGYELSGGKFTEINVPFTGAFDLRRTQSITPVKSSAAITHPTANSMVSRLSELRTRRSTTQALPIP
jgi:hypothetical protein